MWSHRQSPCAPLDPANPASTLSTPSPWPPPSWGGPALSPPTAQPPTTKVCGPASGEATPCIRTVLSGLEPGTLATCTQQKGTAVKQASPRMLHICILCTGPQCRFLSLSLCLSVEGHPDRGHWVPDRATGLRCPSAPHLQISSVGQRAGSLSGLFQTEDIQTGATGHPTAPLSLHLCRLCAAEFSASSTPPRRSRCPRLLCHSPHAGFLYDHAGRGHLLSLVTGAGASPTRASSSADPGVRLLDVQHEERTRYAPGDPPTLSCHMRVAGAACWYTMLRALLLWPVRAGGAWRYTSTAECFKVGRVGPVLLLSVK